MLKTHTNTQKSIKTIRWKMTVFVHREVYICLFIELKLKYYWSLPVVTTCIGLSLPTHPSLDGVMVTANLVPHSTVPRLQSLVVLLQLWWWPASSTADTVYRTPATLLSQVTDTTPVAQLTVGTKVVRGQGAERKSGRNMNEIQGFHTATTFKQARKLYPPEWTCFAGLVELLQASSSANTVTS